MPTLGPKVYQWYLRLGISVLRQLGPYLESYSRPRLFPNHDHETWKSLRLVGISGVPPYLNRILKSPTGDCLPAAERGAFALRETPPGREGAGHNLCTASASRAWDVVFSRALTVLGTAGIDGLARKATTIFGICISSWKLVFLML